jgi:hypothetical protein
VPVINPIPWDWIAGAELTPKKIRIAATMPKAIPEAVLAKAKNTRSALEKGFAISCLFFKFAWLVEGIKQK